MEKIRILLADDHTLFREGLCRLLENEEDLECVATAEDGEEAIRLTKEFLPDVALIDIAMPKMDGIDATKQIKRISPATAILIVSAYMDDDYVLACIEAGVDGYLSKNVRRINMMNAIRIVHAGESVFDHEVANKIMRKQASAKHKESVSYPELSSRELEVLKLAARGMSNKEIAHELNISSQTVGTHFVRIFRKLGVESRMKAALYAFRKGWFTIDDVD